MKKNLEEGDRIEIVRKGYVLHRGVVVERKIRSDGGPWSRDDEILRLQLDDLGPRVFTREISARGQTSEWRVKAKDMRRIGHFSIRHEQGATP